MWALVPAAFIAGLNFHLSFIRPLIYRLRHGSMEDYRHVSGFPMIGTLLVLIGGIVGFGALSSALFGLAAMLVDTGGSLWFLIATWHDRSFWDT